MRACRLGVSDLRIAVWNGLLLLSYVGHLGSLPFADARPIWSKERDYTDLHWMKYSDREYTVLFLFLEFGYIFTCIITIYSLSFFSFLSRFSASVPVCVMICLFCHFLHLFFFFVIFPLHDPNFVHYACMYTSKDGEKRRERETEWGEGGRLCTE